MEKGTSQPAYCCNCGSPASNWVTLDKDVPYVGSAICDSCIGRLVKRDILVPTDQPEGL